MEEGDYCDTVDVEVFDIYAYYWGRLEVVEGGELGRGGEEVEGAGLDLFPEVLVAVVM